MYFLGLTNTTNGSGPWCVAVKLVPVEQLLVENATTDTVQARWLSVRGASGYRLTWASSGTRMKIMYGSGFGPHPHLWKA